MRDFLVLLLAYVLSQFFRAFLAIVAGDLTRELGLDAAQLGMASAAWFVAFFPLVDRGDPFSITLAISVAMVAHGAMYAPQGAFMAELFPTRLRYSGASIAYQATSILAGSLAPLIALSLYKAFGAVWPVSVYVIAGLLVTLFAVLAAHETRGADLRTIA